MLVESGALSVEQLARATAERFGLDHVDLTIYKPDLAAVNLLTAQAAKRFNAIPIGFHSVRPGCSWRWRTRRTCSRSTT